MLLDFFKEHCSYNPWPQIPHCHGMAMQKSKRKGTSNPNILLASKKAGFETSFMK